VKRSTKFAIGAALFVLIGGLLFLGWLVIAINNHISR
jgi:hypothetical protein